jgi:hypothetical protein
MVKRLEWDVSASQHCISGSILVVVTQLATVGENDGAGEGLECARVLRYHTTVMAREGITIARHNVSILRKHKMMIDLMLKWMVYLQLSIQKGL